MSRHILVRSLLRSGALKAAVLAIMAMQCVGMALAQNPNPGGGGGGNNNTLINFGAVGGVAIDAQGVLNNMEVDQLNRLRGAWSKALKQVPGDINEPSEMRKVSLRRLEAAISQHLDDKKPLSDEIRLLGGLQQIRYVFVYSEENDIVLAGFGEGWRVDDQGNVVGMTTGLPVLQLDDLLVALRTADAAAKTGISCSIDPTQEGLARLQQFLNTLAGQTTEDPRPAAAGIEQCLGPQKITLAGVPVDSHFAQVLVAADYRMKRLAMNFEPSPVKGMPSFLQMSKGTGNIMPRWWLAPNYEPLLKDPEGLAWELRGSSVQAMTEDSVLAANGQFQAVGGKKPKSDSVAQKWADSMTKNYEGLSQKMPIFAELSNLMDLAVVAALIAKENLPGKAGFSMPVLTSGQQLPTARFDAPRQVDSKASFIRKGENFIITASGGVQIDSWGIASQSQVQPSLAAQRDKSLPADPKRWWWN